jgi:hypothetical protein
MVHMKKEKLGEPKLSRGKQKMARLTKSRADQHRSKGVVPQKP